MRLHDNRIGCGICYFLAAMVRCNHSFVYFVVIVSIIRLLNFLIAGSCC